MANIIKFQGKGPRSRAREIVFSVQVFVLLGSFHAFAHRGDRVIPIFEITDDMVELIDVKDGRIEEWEELWEPSLTTLDFTREISNHRTLNSEIAANDPSDLDFRIWVGWNDTHNRLYVSGQFADDIHVREITSRHAMDSMFFYVHGDHSGGQYNFLTGDQYRDNLAHAQIYWAPFLAQPELSLGLSYNNFGEPYEFSWAGEFPYGSGGNGANGENPVVWTVEFFITPFRVEDWESDRVLYNSRRW